MKHKLTNTWKHFLYALAISLVLGRLAIIGNASGLGFFPLIVAATWMLKLEYTQKQNSGLSWLAWWKRSGIDSIVDILAGVAGMWLGYHVQLYIVLGVWCV
jgi:hypothetical protein